MENKVISYLEYCKIKEDLQKKNWYGFKILWFR